MFNLRSDDDLKKEAKEITRRTFANEKNMEGYVEGMAFRVLKLERELGTLKTNFWIMFFFVFVLPMFARTVA